MSTLLCCVVRRPWSMADQLPVHLGRPTLRTFLKKFQQAEDNGRGGSSFRLHHTVRLARSDERGANGRESKHFTPRMIHCNEYNGSLWRTWPAVAAN